jgi:4-hydroxyphenylpyruvate dioxygenase-like putative hemolysin
MNTSIHHKGTPVSEFMKNDDSVLLAAVDDIRAQRKAAGLDGLVGGLEALIITTEPERLKPAVAELLATTGHDVSAAFSHGDQDVCVLSQEGSADLLVQARTNGANPFLPFNRGAKTAAVPNTRLETFVFKCRNVKEYFNLQRGRGVAFLDDRVFDTPNYLFVQTMPSRFTGNSVGLVEWKNKESDYVIPGSRPLNLDVVKPDKPFLKNIKELDHVAARVRAEERDVAILEFMSLTGYDFQFAVYVDFLNSITNVARLSPDDYAQVFTSGIAPFTTPEESGPTELFIHNYGARGHHMAFITENIEETVAALMADGVGFLSDLVGSREEGLKQVFTRMSPNTLLVNEYIHRYDGFDGFFTKSNVTLLTKSTLNQ